MRAGQRFGLSAIEKRDVWSRWKAGQTLHEIGRAFGILGWKSLVSKILSRMNLPVRGTKLDMR